MDATRAIMFGGLAGLAGLAMMTLPDYLPPAIAGEEPMRTLLSTPNELWPPAFNPDGLAKWDYYVQPGVSIEPIRESTVRKIGYGKTTMVQIMETDSGIYSTDGLASPHVEYPGIVKEPRASGQGLIWQLLGGRWTVALSEDAGSFTSIIPFKGGQLVTTDEGNCAAIGKSIYC